MSESEFAFGGVPFWDENR